MGATSGLDTFGKIVVIITMYIGRVMPAMIIYYLNSNVTEFDLSYPKAKKMQNVGIWIIIFPSIFIWIIGLTIIARLKKIFIKPIQELNNVISDYNKGNHMRRCPSYTILKDLQKLYDGINQILDNK